MKQELMREPTEKDLKLFEAISTDAQLSEEDEVELIKQIQQGEGDIAAAKEELMHANQRLVREVASRYVSVQDGIDEYIGVGNMGLEKAIYRFDEKRGFKFTTYAEWCIRQSIQVAIVVKARAESESKEMSEREIDILRMFYGIGCEKASLEEIQTKYALTPQRAIFIKEKALRKFFKLSTVSSALMAKVGNKD